jgi:hypothetical protein
MIRKNKLIAKESKKKLPTVKTRQCRKGGEELHTGVNQEGRKKKRKATSEHAT